MRIKLMADYECAPLWWDQAGRMGNIRPEELNLSADLSFDLWAWASAYDATLNRDDPISSGFKSESDQAAFRDQGERLVERLAAELGAGVAVRYHMAG